ARLFFREQDLRHFFPSSVMEYLMAVSKPYRPREESLGVPPVNLRDPPADVQWNDLREMPGAEMPIVVAARLSLSFPLLFSAIPLYAIDYEQTIPKKRKLRLCRFSDGGLCSNFPINLFDAAIPRWPTFGMWLDSAGPFSKRPVSLPDTPGDGCADEW